MSRSKMMIQRRQEALRKQLWPDITDEMLWDRRNRTGFATIPRALPIILTILDSLTPRRPVSATYMALWCRCWDEKFTTLYNKKVEIAVEAGFSGQRAVQTLFGRIDLLTQLGFVMYAAGAGGDKSYALVVSPYPVLLRHKKKVGLMLWNAMLQRVDEIGATDLKEAEALVHRPEGSLGAA